MTTICSSGDVVREYFAACAAGDADRAMALFAPHFTSQTAAGAVFGVDEQAANLRDFLAEFSAIRFSIHTLLECGEQVVTRYTHHLTHAATGLPVDYARIVIHTVRNGLIVESAGVSDSLALAEARAAIAAAQIPRVNTTG